jgi:Glycosyl transferase family 2
MLSVVIPTHHSRYLAETIASVLDQTEPEFELLIVPNGGASLDGVLPDDGRIRVVPYEGPSALGAIKRFAFEAARGDILVALDHDDLLAPQALQRVRAALSAGADFAYSNFAELDFERGESIVHDSYWGWVSRTTEIRGRSVAEMIAFDPTPAALGRAWYAPNHLRAWTRDAYARAGGHDPTMAVCEDHDLAVRTYLTGQMTRIDECLYLQRDHPGRTPLATNDDVQKASEDIYGRSVDSLVVRWAALHGLPCFDLAGAHNNAPGWVTTELDGTRIAADLRGRWPWADSTVGAFRAHDLFAYLPDKQHTMNELHRCLVPGGWVLSSTPSALGQGAFMDPRQCSYWVRNSFYYWVDAAFARRIGNASTRFQVQRLEESFPTEWHAAQQVPYVHFDGVCLKDGFDGPGPHQI